MRPTHFEAQREGCSRAGEGESRAPANDLTKPDRPGRTQRPRDATTPPPPTTWHGHLPRLDVLRRSAATATTQLGQSPTTRNRRPGMAAGLRRSVVMSVSSEADPEGGEG